MSAFSLTKEGQQNQNEVISTILCPCEGHSLSSIHKTSCWSHQRGVKHTALSVPHKCQMLIWFIWCFFFFFIHHIELKCKQRAKNIIFRMYFNVVFPALCLEYECLLGVKNRFHLKAITRESRSRFKLMQ